MKEKFNSRERMLSALENRASDYIPCCFMIFTALAKKCKNQFEFLEKQLELGLDIKVALPELPFRFHKEVKTREWKELLNNEKYPLLHKEYTTPEGKLTSIISKTDDWPYGDRVPLFNDYIAPRSKKFLITCKEDLEKFRFLLGEPTSDDISDFRRQAKKLKKFAEEKGLLISGGWKSYCPEKGIDKDGGTMGADALMWLCGGEKAILLAMDKPEMIRELLQIISDWNIKRMSIYLEEGIDLLIRRAWYEGTELWSPSLYRKLIFPILKKEIDITHQAGAKFGYIMTSGFMPLLDDFLKLGIDVLIGIDPIMGKETDIEKLKEKLAGKVCLWGGLNGFLTIERGNKEKVEEATREAINILGPKGFILSPVDNVTEDSAKSWDNVKTMIQSWEKMRNYGN